MGEFIAALRKAKGLTQRQLAERLNVSDKAVSRWERNETMPDLVLIPVLAEIFDITSDELLRGQRNNPEKAPEVPLPEKREKQVKHILKSTKTNYKIRSTISIGISLLGLIAAMICNGAFLRAYLGFFIGCVFFIGSAVCQAIFLILSLSAVDEELLTDSELKAYREHLVKSTANIYICILTLFLFTFPLITDVWDPYIGLNWGAWLETGIPLMLAMTLICFIGKCVLVWALARAGILPYYAQREARAFLRLKILAVAILILLIIFCGQSLFNALVEPSDFVKGQPFHSLEEYLTYMETPTDESGNPLKIVEFLPIDNYIRLYKFEDQSGEQYHQEIFKGTVGPLHGSQDKTAVTYWQFNQFVAKTTYQWDNDDPFPITVYTHDDLNSGALVIDFINAAFLLLYIPVIIVWFTKYRKYSKKTTE